MNIKTRVKKIIDQQRQQLIKEREEYEEKLNDTMQYWGYGGAYNRQEAAIEKRQQQLRELDDFEYQLNNCVRHKEVGMYVIGCTSCHTVFMTARQLFDDWHECPTCRSMINVHRPQMHMIKIVDEGGFWQEMLDDVIREQKEREQG